MTTPTRPAFFLLLLAFAAQTAEAKRYSADAARSALDRKQLEINQVVGEILRKLGYLKTRGIACTSYPKQVSDHFLQPMENKHVGYRQAIHNEIAKLKAGVQAKPEKFATVDACEGFKQAAIRDFTGKKDVIAAARRALKTNVERPAKHDLHKLYREPQRLLMNKTPYQALTAAFEKTPSVPNCPPDALRVFQSLANTRSEQADLNKFADKVDELDQLFDDYGDSLGSIIRDIERIRCETSVEQPPVKEEPRSEQVPVPRPRPDPRPDPAPASTDTRTATGGFHGLRNGDGPTEIPPGEEHRPEQRPEAAEPPAITESDRWGKPRSWSEYDAYKAQIGAPNKVSGVDLNNFYNEFTSANGIQVRNADDALRLQKAINETTMQVGGPDGIGPSVYQDGQVGSRTKSALYLMQNDPYYRDALLANLRKQGLVR